MDGYFLVALIVSQKKTKNLRLCNFLLSIYVLSKKQCDQTCINCTLEPGPHLRPRQGLQIILKQIPFLCRLSFRIGCSETFSLQWCETKWHPLDRFQYHDKRFLNWSSVKVKEELTVKFGVIFQFSPSKPVEWSNSTSLSTETIGLA